MDKDKFHKFIKKITRKKLPLFLAVLLLVCAIVIPSYISIYTRYNRFSAKNPVELSEYFVKKTDRSAIHLIAHRGFSAQAPENTVPAIETAAKMGFDTVEIDIRQTQDGVWVLSHDADVKSMTDKRGKISSYTYYDLVCCKIDNGANHKKYDNLTIPTLEQALKACLEYNIKPMIEIKDYTDDGIKNLIALIDKNGFTKSCSVISFDRTVLDKVHELNKDIKLYALVSKLNRKEMKNCLADTSIGVSFDGHKKTNNKEKIEELQNAGIALACWTVDDKETMQKYLSWGITNFVTNKVYK